MSEPVIYDLIRRMDAAPHGGKRAIVEAFARAAGLSVGQVYRRVQAARGRKRRRTGTPRVSAETIRAVEAVRVRCSDPSAGRMLPADAAIELAERDGLITETVSPGQFHRRARAAGLRRRRRVVRYQAERSNELHHVDASGAEYLRVVRRDGELVVAVDPPGRSWKNRPRDVAERLWLYGVVDDHSRVQAVRYVIGPGESSLDTQNVLAWAWDRNDDARRVLSGVPERLCCDNGPFISSAEGRQFLDTLGVEYVPRMPGNKEAGGKIERPWRTLWARFELQFLADPKHTYTLDEMNDMLTNYLVRENARAHPFVPAVSRTAVYLQGRGEVRELPAGYLRASFRTSSRLVYDDGTVRFDNVIYRVADELIGEHVHVYQSRAAGLACSGPDGRVYTLEPFAPHPAGEFHTPVPQPGDAIALAVGDLPTMRPTFADDTEPATLAMPAAGKPVEIDTPFDHADCFASADQAVVWLGDHVGVPLAAFGPENIEEFTRRVLAHDLACDYVERLADEIRERFAAG